jgi:hypothetical protein
MRAGRAPMGRVDRAGSLARMRTGATPVRAEVFMKTLIRLEELGFFLLSIYLFSLLPYPWWFYPLLFFIPDLAMLGYLAGPRVGAIVYNSIHHRGLALIYYLAGVLLAFPVLSLAGVIVFAHSSLDRVLGYGLKFTDSFGNTHLGRIGRASAE